MTPDDLSMAEKFYSGVIARGADSGGAWALIFIFLLGALVMHLEKRDLYKEDDNN